MKKTTKKKKQNESKKINRALIEKAIKDSAYATIPRGTGFQKVQLKVSPEFIDEYIDRIFVGIEANVRAIAQHVFEDGKRKTLMVKYKGKDAEPVVDDVIHYFNGKEANTLAV